ncbi:MAG: ADP-glyceromanno-heptose 6-epimerase [Tepidisphaeraceae bacterium]
MPKLTVVTGAAGFIGRNVVAELNRRGNSDLLLTDVLGTDEKWQNLVGLRYEDLLNPDQLIEKIETNALGEVDAIIHLGACSATTEKDADYLLENNYRYTRTLCEWSLRHGARFVYASSGATYGDGSLGYDDADTVTPNLKPLNMYGYSKHMFDLWALKNDLYKKGIVGLKYFNVFGPYEDHKADMRSVVNKAYQQILKTGEVTLFKSDRPEYRDGEQMRDFVYVKDAADVTIWFATDRQAPGGLYNCGTGQARTWVDLAQATFAAMGRRPVIRFIDMPATLKGKYQYFTQAESAKLKAAGFTTPFRTLEEAVKDYVDTYLRPTFGG